MDDSEYNKVSIFLYYGETVYDNEPYLYHKCIFSYETKLEDTLDILDECHQITSGYSEELDHYQLLIMNSFGIDNSLQLGDIVTINNDAFMYIENNWVKL